MQEDFDGLSERDASQAETACSRDRTGWQAYEEEEFADSELGSESGDVLQDMQSARNGDVLRFKRPFDGFDPAIMKLGTRRPQPLVLPRGESWKCIENLSDGDLVPVRAEVFNIPASFLTVDSKTFGSWHTQKKISHRMTASAALLSLLFQGRAAGIPSGEHEEWARSSKEEEEEAQEADGSESPAPSRGRKRKKKGESSSLKHVSKYTYISPLDEDDSWPMYQIGCEEVKSVDGCKLLAWRIWMCARPAMCICPCEQQRFSSACPVAFAQCAPRRAHVEQDLP
jgi:hypothetical protein